MIKQVDMINKMNKCQHLWWSSGNGAETSGQWLLACQEHFVSHTCTHTSMHTHTLTRSHIIWRENYSLLIFVNWVGFICLSFQCLNWFFFQRKGTNSSLGGRVGSWRRRPLNAEGRVGGAGLTHAESWGKEVWGVPGRVIKTYRRRWDVWWVPCVYGVALSPLPSHSLWFQHFCIWAVCTVIVVLEKLSRVILWL